jgi:predicted nuclease of predicted toxin-antitoxin system
VKFKVDEDLPADVAMVLRSAGHEAESVHDEGMTGWADPDIALRCQAEKRTLVTLDTGFADMRAYPPGEHASIIVMRLGRQDKPHVLAVLRGTLPLFGREPLQGRLWIVQETRVRIRS